MKRIGLIGGLSWQSTVDYYRIINELENQYYGSSRTGEVLVYSVNLEEMLDYAGKKDYAALARRLGDAARALEGAGAELILLCTNTMHIVFPEIQAQVSVPMLHIADALAAEIRRRGFDTVGLMGTPFTMELPFYREKLMEEYGIRVIIPPPEDHETIFRIIREELTFDIIREESRKTYLDIIDGLSSRGAQGVILGCTEIPMLVQQKYTQVPVFDTTYLHAAAAVKWAIGAPEREEKK
jgi:aspartate racemase